MSIEKKANTLSWKYSFTVTLKPNLYKDTANIQYDLTVKRLRHIIASLDCTATIVAELTSGWNIHYHGILQFEMIPDIDYNQRSLMKVFTDYFRNHRHFGFVNIKPITDEQGWIDYMSKDLDDFYNILGRGPIIKDDYRYYINKEDKLFYMLKYLVKPNT